VSVKVYQYPKCSTCRKALTWLDERGIEVEAIDITEKPPSKTALKRYWKASGLPLKKLFNTSGRSYRGGGFKDRLPSMSDDEQLAALAADGKLIKRPIVVAGDTVLVGFSADRYAEALG
jgi:arsenate reductase